MAAVNRYTNIEPARYNPMSLQELMLAPQYKRTQHDQLLQAGASLNEELLKADPLDIHADAVKGEQDRLGNSIQSQVDLLSKEGFNPNSKQAFFDLNKQYNQAVAPTGTIGKANTAKMTLAANKKAHIDAAVKEGFSMDEALMNWQEHEKKYIDEYKATGDIKPISSLGNPKYVDYLDEANKLFKDAGFTERDLAGGMVSQIITTDPRGQYVLNKSGGKITKNNIQQLTSAVEWLNSNVNNPNSEIGKSIRYQGKNPNQVLQEIGNLAEIHIEDSQKSDYSQTITGFKSAKELGVGLDGSTAFTAMEATNVKRFNDSLSSALSDIIDGKEVSVMIGNNTKSVNASNAAGFNTIGTTSGGGEFKKELANVENTLNAKQKAQYDNIYDVLMSNDNVATLLNDKYSPEVAQEIQNYVTKYSDVLRQDIIVQGDIVKTYGNSTGINSKSSKDIDTYNKTNRADLQYSYDGKEYTFNELPEEVRLQYDKAIYQGTMSPKNFRGFGKESNSDLYVSPHVYTLVDPNTGETEKLLVGRPSHERVGVDWKADKIFNKAYQETITTPLKEIYYPEIGAIVKYNPDNKSTPFILKSPRTGKTTAVDDVTLQNAIIQTLTKQ